jgi:proteasome lid subunit RPN8/RPN11
MHPRFVTNVKVAGLAATKILMHAKRGVDEGVALNGMPLEIMGLLFGHPADDGKTVIITDAFEVPAKGGAHAVEMDPETSVYMSGLSDTLGETRPEGKLCGWFHSHPFDTNALDEALGKTDHCWFSQIDVQNQHQWQYAFEFGDGIPFVGIVVDPKTSIQRRRLVMRAFRNYSNMAEYDPGAVMPDGKPEPQPHYAFERWGSAWKNYYEVPIEYFNSAMGNMIIDMLGGVLWVDELASSPTMELPFVISAPGRISEIADDLSKAAPQVTGGRGVSTMFLGGGGASGGGGGGAAASEGDTPTSLLQKAQRSSSKFTAEIATGCVSWGLALDRAPSRTALNLYASSARIFWLKTHVAQGRADHL